MCFYPMPLKQIRVSPDAPDIDMPSGVWIVLFSPSLTAREPCFGTVCMEAQKLAGRDMWPKEAMGDLQTPGDQEHDAIGMVAREQRAKDISEMEIACTSLDTTHHSQEPFGDRQWSCDIALNFKKG